MIVNKDIDINSIKPHTYKRLAKDLKEIEENQFQVFLSANLTQMTLSLSKPIF